MVGTVRVYRFPLGLITGGMVAVHMRRRLICLPWALLTQWVAALLTESKQALVSVVLLGERPPTHDFLINLAKSG